MDEDTDWTLIDFDEPKANTGAVKAAPVLPSACPKCGKTLGRGKHLHLKHCKGPK